jgi:hypothetical protein
MRKKIIPILVSMLIIFTTFSMTVFGGSEDDPEVEDRIGDVKIFGIIPFFPQVNFGYADIVSAWIYEEENNPDFLYMGLKIRDLEDTTDKYDAIYVIVWTFNNIEYSAGVHIFPEGPTPLTAGSVDKEGNDYVDFVVCDGSIDSVNDIITWIIPKDAIGNPTTGLKITDIFPHTHLRNTPSSGLPLWDLFKDLSWNAKITRDYIIRY